MISKQIRDCIKLLAHKCNNTKIKVLISLFDLMMFRYHATIVAIGHGLLNVFWPMVIGCVLRTEGSFLYFKQCRPAKLC